MNAIRYTSALSLLLGATWLASPGTAQEIEELVGQHMAAEALLAAHLIAVADERSATQTMRLVV